HTARLQRLHCVVRVFTTLLGIAKGCSRSPPRPKAQTTREPASVRFRTLPFACAAASHSSVVKVPDSLRACLLHVTRIVALFFGDPLSLPQLHRSVKGHFSPLSRLSGNLSLSHKTTGTSPSARRCTLGGRGCAWS